MRLDNLQFVLAEEEDAAVSPVHGIAVGLGGCDPFDVELAIAERPLGPQFARLKDIDLAVLESRGVSAGPLVEIAAVKEHDGVGWRLPRLSTGGNPRRLRTVAVMNPPRRARQEWSVRIAGAVRGNQPGWQQQDRGRQYDITE